jgi:hypothetical protein
MYKGEIKHGEMTVERKDGKGISGHSTQIQRILIHRRNRTKVSLLIERAWSFRQSAGLLRLTLTLGILLADLLFCSEGC